MKWLIGILSFLAGIAVTLLTQWAFKAGKGKVEEAIEKAEDLETIMSGLNKKERQELADGLLTSIGDNSFNDDEPMTGNAYTGVDPNIPRREEDCIH